MINFVLAGMDAQVSYAFHSERKLHPEKFKNQLNNQVIIFSMQFKCDKHVSGHLDSVLFCSSHFLMDEPRIIYTFTVYM